MVLINAERICMIKGDDKELRIWFDGDKEKPFVFEGGEAENILNIVRPDRSSPPRLNFSFYDISCAYLEVKGLKRNEKLAV